MSKRGAEPGRNGCRCVHTPRFRYIVGIAAVTLLVMLAAGAARRATVSPGKQIGARLQSAGASQGAQATDEVWRGVTSVNTSAPQLCRAGADLVCARYNAVVVYINVYIYILVY
jgi:hypothetical protein